jgi:hypothetical protein
MRQDCNDPEKYEDTLRHVVFQGDHPLGVSVFLQQSLKMLSPFRNIYQYFRVKNNDCQVKNSTMGEIYQSMTAGSNLHSR